MRHNNAFIRYVTSRSLKIQKEVNLIYNITAFKLAITRFLLNQVCAITNISRYGQNINLSYRDLYLTKGSFDNKESWVNSLNCRMSHEVSIKDVNIRKISKLINKLNKLNYFKNE